ncbi:MAG: fasciclin domain-containing protein [Acidimicrobiales bacterium]
MRRLRPLKLTALALTLVAATAACSASQPTVAVSGDPRAPHSPDAIPAFLAADDDERFTTLLACVEAAGGIGVLDGVAPVTLFAPTNEAFAKAGLSCDPQRQLAAVEVDNLVRTLAQHVVPFDVRFSEPDGYDAENPPRLLELVDNGTVTLKSELTDATGTDLVISDNQMVRPVGAPPASAARVVDADLQAPNGMVQVIDRLLTPPAASQFPPTTAAPNPYD